MKKLMTALLGLSLMTGMASVVFGQTKTDDTTKTTKAKKAKKAKKSAKKDDTTKMEQK
jgi:hypothetical protein